MWIACCLILELCSCAVSAFWLFLRLLFAVKLKVLLVCLGRPALAIEAIYICAKKGTSLSIGIILGIIVSRAYKFHVSIKSSVLKVGTVGNKT